VRLAVVDRVTSGDERAGFTRDGLAALEHAREHRQWQLLDRPPDEVEREDRASAHRVHVGERVRRGDASPVVGVVDDRCEEVGREDQRGALVELVYRGVVAGRGADEQRWVGGKHRLEVAHHLREFAGPELARAPGAVAERREPDVLLDGALAHLAGREE
jgi:hypothetical protein